MNAFDSTHTYVYVLHFKFTLVCAVISCTGGMKISR